MGFTIGNLTRLPLGWQGESNARLIDIDMSEWMRDWPNATVDMLVQRPGEEEYSPVDVKLRGGHLLWKPTRADVLIAGMGRAQIILTDANDVELRTRVVETIIGESLKGTEGEAPAPVNGWLHEVLQAAKDAREAVDKMPRISENGTWLVWDAEASAYVDTGIVADAGTAVKLKNLVDGSTNYSVRSVAAMEDGEELVDGTEYKQGYSSYALGMGCATPGQGSVAIGFYSEARGPFSFAGGYSETDGVYSVAIGESALAAGDNSAAFGAYVTAQANSQTVIGRQNIPDKDGKYAFIIGNGDAETVGEDYQSNAFAVDWEGNAYVGNGKKLATEEAVEAMLNGPTILPETELEGRSPSWAVTTPWEQPFVAGQVYTVKYNGVAYECEAYEVEQGGIMLYLLGNLVAMGLGGNPDAPFMLAAVDNATGAEMGAYGELEVTDFPASVTMGITASNAPAKAKQYTVIIDSDRSINSSVSFDTLAKMTDAEIQASVSVARLQDGDTYTSSVKQVNRYVQDGTVAVVQLQIGDLVDFSNEVYTSDITGYITFAEGFQPMMSTGYTQTLPYMTHWDKGTAYMRYNGERWEPVGIDQLKEDLGLGGGGGDATTDVFYTADGEVFTTVDGAVMHVQKGAK